MFQGYQPWLLTSPFHPIRKQLLLPLPEAQGGQVISPRDPAGKPVPSQPVWPTHQDSR